MRRCRRGEGLLSGWSLLLGERLQLGRGIDQAGDIVLELRQFLFIEVDHVAGFVILEIDLAAEICGQMQMIHGEFRGEKRRGQIEPSIFRLYL